MAIPVIPTAILTETGRATAVTAVTETAVMAMGMEAMAAVVTAAMVPLILTISSADSVGPATVPQDLRYSRVTVM